ncbi:hypothetical protein KKG16_00605 [Patescibacteria group bacterium]|nr:hypothetical protein [Patescibacteria group bacterium]
MPDLERNEWQRDGQSSFGLGMQPSPWGTRITIAFILILLGGLFYTFVLPKLTHAYRVNLTQAKVVEFAERLDLQYRESGEYIRFGGSVYDGAEFEQDENVIVLPVKDGWGNSLVVAYLSKATLEELYVFSAGPDGIFLTEDDIMCRQYTGVRKTLKRVIKHGIQETAKNWAKGLVRGLKDEIFHKSDGED